MFDTEGNSSLSPNFFGYLKTTLGAKMKFSVLRQSVTMTSINNAVNKIRFFLQLFVCQLVLICIYFVSLLCNYVEFS
jgi:hypothetical protein